MGIRQKINENPAATTAVTAVIVVLAILFIFWQACGGEGSGAVNNTNAFFTTDDGKTWFVDKSTNIPPYTKDGKQAVRARVFTCDGGKTKFVGYLQMYNPQDKAMLENMAKGTQGKTPGPPAYVGYGGQAMVKRPGDPPSAWIAMGPTTMQYYQMIVQPKCPGGKPQESLTEVFPD